MQNTKLEGRSHFPPGVVFLESDDTSLIFLKEVVVLLVVQGSPIAQPGLMKGKNRSN